MAKSNTRGAIFHPRLERTPKEGQGMFWIVIQFPLDYSCMRCHLEPQNGLEEGPLQAEAAAQVPQLPCAFASSPSPPTDSGYISAWGFCFSACCFLSLPFPHDSVFLFMVFLPPFPPFCMYVHMYAVCVSAYVNVCLCVSLRLMSKIFLNCFSCCILREIAL